MELMPFVRDAIIGILSITAGLYLAIALILYVLGFAKRRHVREADEVTWKEDFIYCLMWMWTMSEDLFLELDRYKRRRHRS